MPTQSSVSGIPIAPSTALADPLNPWVLLWYAITYLFTVLLLIFIFWESMCYLEYIIGGVFGFEALIREMLFLFIYMYLLKVRVFGRCIDLAIRVVICIVLVKDLVGQCPFSQ